MTPIRSVRLATFALLAGTAGAASAHDLTVEVMGARSDQGQIAGALFGAAPAWLKEPLQGARQPASGKTVLVYRGLPAGRYALSFFHDVNGNGKLDTNVAGIPTEPYAFSRDAQGRMGPPAFDDAAIELTGDLTITVQLR